MQPCGVACALMGMAKLLSRQDSDSCPGSTACKCRDTTALTYPFGIEGGGGGAAAEGGGGGAAPPAAKPEGAWMA